MTSEGFWLLARAMYRNIAEDRRAATLGMASGVGIGFGGEKVHREWLAAQDEPEAPGAKADNAAAAQQLGVVMRLQALYGQQSSAGLRGAIKFRKPD